MRGCGEEMFNEIAFFFFSRPLAGGHADHAFAAPPLRPERAHRGAFDKATVGDADDASLVGDEILHVDLAFIHCELSQPRRTMFIAQLAQLFLDDSENALLLGQNVAQVLDRLDQVLVFAVDLVALKTSQLIQTEIENLVGLMLTEGVTAIGQARGIANEDADLLDLLFGELECEQFDSRFFAIG